MRETEITVQVFGSEEDIKNLIKSKGFYEERQVVMMDNYFSMLTMEQLDKLNYEDIMKNSFLVRKLVGETTNVLLHYKDKELDDNGNVVSEEKLSSALVDAESASKIFLRAGLNNWANITQHMTIFTNDKIHFALQVVDDLGIYIEYEEDETVSGLSVQNKISAMVNTIKAIGLNIGEDYSVKKVYELFLKNNKNI